MATIGVKLELNGAASYTEGMKQATSQVKLFDAQLKGLTSGMSSASNAFTKHKQTTEALQGKLSALKDEQALLTQKLEETKAKYGDNSTQANNLATKLEYLNQKISATEEELKNQGGSLGAVGAQLQEWGGKLDAVGKKAQASRVSICSLMSPEAYPPILKYAWLVRLMGVFLSVVAL
jgi:chromosome segregation ATPase